MFFIPRQFIQVVTKVTFGRKFYLPRHDSFHVLVTRSFAGSAALTVIGKTCPSITLFSMSNNGFVKTLGNMNFTAERTYVFRPPTMSFARDTPVANDPLNL